eukprot:TRINITY_DN2595_c0_g1_i1.p1 TRINITY_DN2595_c0_g1~~TRINITY_DN2595_c0_g1_i1.p1  ORF type:complete len:785 (-),score=249.31 TRINITY_DN2595_c0_g1_i1:560-2914(-)
MSKRRTNNGWDEEEDDDWTKVKFDDDDDEEDAKRSKFKFQIKLAPNSPSTVNNSNSNDNSNHNAVEQTNGHSEADANGGAEEKDAAVKLAPLLALPKQQSSSMRGRRWGQKESDSNDEFEQIIKRATLTESDQAKYTITPDDLEDNTKDYVGIPAIVVHPFVPDSSNELQLNLGEAVLILSTHTQHHQIDEASSEASDPVWYYGRLLREQTNASSHEHKSNDSDNINNNNNKKPTIRQKAGFFSSHFVVKLCEESLSFDTAKEIIKPASRARVLFDRAAEFDKEIELSLSRGDDLLVIHKQNNGWWIGKRSNAEVHHRHIGFFPSNHVEEIPIGDDDPIIAQEEGSGSAATGGVGVEGTLFDSSPFSDTTDFDSAFGDKADEWSSSMFLSMAFSGTNNNTPTTQPQHSRRHEPWSATVNWKPRDDVNENRRAVAILTFLDDEQLYLDSMHDFIDHYLHPVKETVRKEIPSLSFHEITAMFTHFQQILDNHKHLFGQLCKRLESVAEDGSLCILIGDVIRQTDWMHDLYVKYAITCPLLVEAVKVAQHSPELQIYLKSRKTPKEINLPELIEQPLNHIDQFSKFVSKLNEATPKDHEDKTATKEVLATIDTTVNVANATRRHSAAVNPDVRRVYDTLHPKLLNLLSPTQAVISEGVLFQWLKPSSSAEELLDGFKERRYIILNNVLLLSSSTPEHGSDCYGLKLHVTLSTTRAEKAPLPGSILKEKWGIPFSISGSTTSRGLTLPSSNATITSSCSILLHTPKKPILLFALDESQRQLILRSLEQ